MSSRTHLIISVAMAAIACLWLLIPGVKELAADNIWYLESGRKIIGMNFDIENLVFSPLYSILAFTWFSISLKLNATLSIVIEWIACLIFSAFTWYLLLAIPRFSIIDHPTDMKSNDLIRISILALFIFNPVLLKYSLPTFSDSFSVIGGTLFAFFHGMDPHSSHQKARKFVIKGLDPISKGMVKLHQMPALYFTIIGLLCFFRYGNFFLLLASILFYCSSKNLKYKWSWNPASLQTFKLFLIASAATITTIIIDFSLKYYKGTNLTIIENLLTSVTPSRLAEKLPIILILTIGGREGFLMTINDPTALLNFNLLQGRYLAGGYYLSYTEYIFSLTYLLIMTIAFLISLFGMWEKRRQIYGLPDRNFSSFSRRISYKCSASALLPPFPTQFIFRIVFIQIFPEKIF